MGLDVLVGGDGESGLLDLVVVSQSFPLNFGDFLVHLNKTGITLFIISNS